MAEVLLCGAEDGHPDNGPWLVTFPCEVEVDLPDPLLDGPESAVLFHAMWTWKATGDLTWRP